jgi:hypothetical protein
MEEEPVLREALARRDAALAEARRLDEFVRLYNELRGRIGGGKYGEVVGLQQSPPLVVVGDSKGGGSEGEFILDKSRPNIR